MTIGIVCNLSDGVIIGADSAITLQGESKSPSGKKTRGVLKVYNEAEKIFHLENSKVGILIYGTAILGKRTIESFVREFEIKEKEISSASLFDICENIRKFFFDKYNEIIKPALEQTLGKTFNEIPDDKKPFIGLVLAGFSPEKPLSEVYDIKIPFHKEKKQIDVLRKPGQFGTNWFGSVDPIRRLIKGFDINLVNNLVGYFVKRHKIKFNKQLNDDIGKLLNAFEYKIPYDAMPLQEGIDHVKSLLDIVINHYKFVIGAPVCGGSIRIAAITRDGYKNLSNNELKINY